MSKAGTDEPGAEAGSPEDRDADESRADGRSADGRSTESLARSQEESAAETAAEGHTAKSGTVALVGRPNAGKSTLMNQLLEEKLAIVSNKPQTTRNRLVGILSEARGQIVFFDTPGVHKPLHHMNRRMLKAAREAVGDADVVLLMHDTSQPLGSGDRYMLEWLGEVRAPRLAILNKIDRVRKPDLLPRIAAFAEEGNFTEIIPVSALKGDGVELVLDALFRLLPDGEPIYDPELLTVHPERFLVAERIREKVLEQTRDELPFSTAVVVDAWIEDQASGKLEIHASILAEREGQKKILVGSGGQRIKAIGTAARKDLEQYLDRKLYLGLKVRVERDWRDSQRILTELEQAPFDAAL